MTLDFFASNEAQQAKAAFRDIRFNKPIQWLKFPPTTSSARIDILPISATRTHAIIKEHLLPGCRVLCPTMFDKPCPFCDAIAVNRGDDWYWKTLKPKDRALFNVVYIVDGKPQKMNPEQDATPIYLYEVGAPQKKASGFWLLLIAAMSSADSEDAYKKQFFSWDKGSTIKISFLPDSYNGNAFANPAGLEFVHPRHDYSKDRAKYEPHLYKIPDIYQEPNLEELNDLLSMMVKHRHGGAYSPSLTSSGDGFYAGTQQEAAGSDAWATASDDAGVF